ncbi:MAG: hypothetical protein EA357_07860 [Micavibrio sp.]|nr:MAG: hypothetical protein EA357_07860 [Micavibrio sp.]
MRETANDIAERSKRMIHGNCDWSISMPLAILGRAVGLALAGILIAAGLFVYGLVVFQAAKFGTHVIGLVADVINSKRKAEWTNRSGQHIRSTVLQKKVLQRAERRIAKTFNSTALPCPSETVHKIEAQYEKTAQKVKIIDREGQEKTQEVFHFSREEIPPGRFDHLQKYIPDTRALLTLKKRSGKQVKQTTP